MSADPNPDILELLSAPNEENLDNVDEEQPMDEDEEEEENQEPVNMSLIYADFLIRQENHRHEAALDRLTFTHQTGSLILALFVAVSEEMGQELGSEHVLHTFPQYLKRLVDEENEEHKVLIQSLELAKQHFTATLEDGEE